MFCVLQKKNATGNYDDLKRVYGDSKISRRACFPWHNDFKHGRESAELQGVAGAPITAITDTSINTAGCVHNARLHAANAVTEFLVQKGTTTLPHPH
ncbi:hypothetical protein C0J52_13653 [Blattella germanica]|nr:hypothetical protein C0J52_13653 [Blattella germanica]